MKKGFTLVELVIVIVIVGILSIIAVPIYRGMVHRARLTEGKALAAAIRQVEQVYYAEHGEWYATQSGHTSFDEVLRVDARSNKYFDTYQVGIGAGVVEAWAYSPADEFGAVTLYWAEVPGSGAKRHGYDLPVFSYYDYAKGAYTYSNS